MRSRIGRHIGSLARRAFLDEVAEAAPGSARAASVDISDERDVPPEFSSRQYAIFLLHIAAGLEHALMVQYLYAAYSLGGPGVPVAHQVQVARWQETILGIAKEEMGHLMTVQNLLRCLGGPLNFDRDDYPWDSEFYPFPFQLEPLTRQSLAKYVYAESPPPDASGKEVWTGREADEVRALACQGVDDGRLNRVGGLYDQIESLFADPQILKDADFRGSTFPYQANWDEWGRGYRGGARGAVRGAAIAGTPDVLLLPVTSRSDSLAAIRAVALQGEANPAANEQAPSHFARFLEIFRHFPRDQSWSPSRNVPVNPIVVTEFGTAGPAPAWRGTAITHPQSKLWGHLLNLRYQALLANLIHTFEYPSNLSEVSQKTPRGLLLNAAFGEMYNVRAVSEILVQAPLSTNDAHQFAGPPFQMPYTLKLPLDSADRWRLHEDLLRASATLIDRLLDAGQTTHRDYLLALKKIDLDTVTRIKAILNDMPASAADGRRPSRN